MAETYLTPVYNILQNVETPEPCVTHLKTPWYLVAAVLTFSLLVALKPAYLMKDTPDELQVFSYFSAFLFSTLVAAVVYYIC